jgi:hypothetical protein
VQATGQQIGMAETRDWAAGGARTTGVGVLQWGGRSLSAASTYPARITLNRKDRT